jgi:hypothetical protein
MPRLLKDPLIHFLLVGACLFAVLAWRDGASRGDERERIVISAEQIDQLRRSTAVVRGAQPTGPELERLVEPLIRDEVLYREALALGLDVDDDSVRTRMIEKMRYLTEDLADPEPASEAELEAFFEASPELFRIPAKVTFEQVYLSPRERGESVEQDAATALARLEAGADPAGFGDRTPLQNRYAEAPREQIEVLFGSALADAVFSVPPGSWTGPYRSDFGWHLVRLVSRSEARQPSFAESRDVAREVFAAERRRRANAARYAEIRARYDVVVEWPEGAERTE